MVLVVRPDASAGASPSKCEHREQQSPLLRSHKLGIPNNVDEEHVGDFQLDLFFRFSGHSGVI